MPPLLPGCATIRSRWITISRGIRYVQLAPRSTAPTISMMARREPSSKGRIQKSKTDRRRTGWTLCQRPDFNLRYSAPSNCAGRRSAVGGGGGRGAVPLPARPSIAVLPFANLIGDSEQEYFADGMVDDILMALSRACAGSS